MDFCLLSAFQGIPSDAWGHAGVLTGGLAVSYMEQ